MDWRRTELDPGLYLVSTPIGAARDVTLRALDVLASAEVLAAEDTRTLRHLMEIHGVPLEGRPLLAYHDRNGPRARPGLLRHLGEGRSVAYASEAGTPLVADPGFTLAREAIAAGAAVHAVPGPSALLAALTVSGLPSDRFLFAGFPPATGAARRRWIEDLRHLPATLVLYESPRRVHDLLAILAECFGSECRAVVCRELTKRHEEVARAPLGQLAERFSGAPPKGEVVVLVDRAPAPQAAEGDIDAALAEALATMSVKDAAEAVARAHGLGRRDVYRAALRLAGRE